MSTLIDLAGAFLAAKRTPYQIVCYECNKLLRDGKGVNLVADIYSDQRGEDVCEECHEKHVAPYIIEDDAGNVIGFHNRDCGPVEVEYIDPQPENINDTWWFYIHNIYTAADMQQRLLEEADLNRDGGPILVDGLWYWSPIFDDEEWAEGSDLWTL